LRAKKIGDQENGRSREKVVIPEFIEGGVVIVNGASINSATPNQTNCKKKASRKIPSTLFKIYYEN